MATKVTRFLFSNLSGNAILHPPMAVEKLGVWQNQCTKDGPRPGHHFRGRKTTEEKAATRLPLLEPEKSQLLGI